jgi:hypothetical protein
MSAVASVSSPANPYQTQYQNGFAQTLEDFNSIGSALQSGDLSSAQSALTAFQQDLQGNSQTSSNQPFGQNTKANTDYQSLTSALQAGDLSGAQSAFANLQKDLEGSGRTHRRHHHGSDDYGAADAAASTTGTSSSSTSSTSGTVASTTNTANPNSVFEAVFLLDVTG